MREREGCKEVGISTIQNTRRFRHVLHLPSQSGMIPEVGGNLSNEIKTHVAPEPCCLFADPLADPLAEREKGAQELTEIWESVLF